jgi:hypothetical protein
MILLYALAALLLGLSAFVTGRRARALEHKFIRAANQADALAKEMSYRGGNNSAADPLRTARRQFELGRMVQARDRLETKYDTWEARAEKYRKLRDRLRNCRGRFVPYVFGVIDVVAVVALATATHIIDPAYLRNAFDAARMVVSR